VTLRSAVQVDMIGTFLLRSPAAADVLGKARRGRHRIAGACAVRVREQLLIDRV
jgi:hypothetical protein